MIIGGDFNLPSIHWGDEVYIQSNSQYGTTVNELLVDIADRFALTQIVEEPTRQHNILDLVFSTT